MKSQKGFTLIELVVVIVILGILAATALPKFIDVSTDAGDSVAAGTAAALTSAASINYAKFRASGTASTAVVHGTTTCSGLTPLLQGGALPADVTFTDTATAISCASPAGAGGTNSTTCKLQHAKGTTGGTASTLVTVICTG